MCMSITQINLDDPANCPWMVVGAVDAANVHVMWIESSDRIFVEAQRYNATTNKNI
jgi:hypothetical protein